MGRMKKQKDKMLEGTGVTPTEAKPKVVRGPSPDITAFRTSKRPKNPIVVLHNQSVDAPVHSPQIALEPETFDVPPSDALAASIDLEIGKSSSLDDVVNSSADLLSMDLTYLDVGPVSLTEDPQLELFGLLPSINNPSNIAREVLNCLATGGGVDKEGDDPEGTIEDSSDDSSDYEPSVDSSTGDLTTEESESECDGGEHIVGLNELHDSPLHSEHISREKTSTFAEAETVSLDSCDEDDENRASYIDVCVDKNDYSSIPSNDQPSLEVQSTETLNINSSDSGCLSPKYTSETSLDSNLAPESSTDKSASAGASSDSFTPLESTFTQSNPSPCNSPSTESFVNEFKSPNSNPSPCNSPSTESFVNEFKSPNSNPSPCNSPSTESFVNEFKSPNSNPSKASPSEESSPVKPDSSLPQSAHSPDEFQRNNPSTNFSENFADYMSLSTLGSFGSSLYFTKESVPTLVTFKREMPLEGESDPFAEMGINLEDLVHDCAAPVDIINDPSAPPMYSFPLPEASQSFSPSCSENSRRSSIVENCDNIPIQSSTLSTSSSNLLLDNLGHLHRSIGTSQKSSALFGAPLLISPLKSTAVEISDCHVSSTQEYSVTPISDDNASTSTYSSRKRHPSQIITARSDNETDEDEMLRSGQQVAHQFDKDLEFVSEEEQEMILMSDVEQMESQNEIQPTAHVYVENETTENIPSPEQLNILDTSQPIVLSSNENNLNSSGTEIPAYSDEITICVNVDSAKRSQIQNVTVDSDCSKQLDKFIQPQVVSSNEHLPNTEHLTDAFSELQQESHLEAEPLNTNLDLNNPEEGVVSSISSSRKELNVNQPIPEPKKRKPGPASKTRIVAEPTVLNSPKSTSIESLTVSPSIPEPEQASSTSATLEIATVKFSIPSKPDHLSIVPMKPLNTSHYKNSKVWMYTPEHKVSLYGEDQFLVDREHLKNYEDSSIPVWRIWKTRKLLQKFVPIEIDGRCFHQGVDEFRLFPEVEDELYIKYQPIIFDIWIDTKSHQLGIYYNVMGSYPYLGYFPLTTHLHDDFKDFLQKMASRAMSDRGGVVKRGTSARKDETAQDVIFSHLKEIILDECFPQAFPLEVLIHAIEYPRMYNTRSHVKKNVSCCCCERMGRTKPSYFKAIFDGDLYDHVTFHLTTKQGHGKQSAFQFCRICTKYLNAFHRIVHYKFWLFIAFRLQLRKLYSELKEGQKFHPDDVLKFLTGDFHFNKMCFYEFQAVYSEGYHSRDRLQKEIILLGKKQKGTSDGVQNAHDSAEHIKTFQKSIKEMFCKSRSSSSTSVSPSLCIEASNVAPAKTELENSAKANRRKQVKRKNEPITPQKQSEISELTKCLESHEQSRSTAHKNGSLKVDNHSPKDCGNPIETRKATKKSRKREVINTDVKVSQLGSERQVGTCDTDEIHVVTSKKTKLSTPTVIPRKKGVLKQSTHLEPADSTSSSSAKRTKSNKGKPSVVAKTRSKDSSPTSNVNTNPPPKRKKTQGKNDRQLLKSAKSTSSKSCLPSSNNDSEMDMVIETTKEISDFMEQFQQVSNVPSEAQATAVTVASNLPSGQNQVEEVFDFISIEIVS